MDRKQINKWMISVIVVLLILNVATLSGLWYTLFNHRRPLPPDRSVILLEDLIAEKLGFSSNQQEEFRQLHKTHRHMKDSLESRSFELADRILDELFSSSPDTLRVEALADTIGELRAAFEKNLFNHFTDLKAISQPDQFVKIETLLRKMLRHPEHIPPPEHDVKQFDRHPNNHRGGRRPPPPPDHR